MKQLDADQLEQLKKCSTDRLRLKLMCVGEEEDDVIGMDRPKLLKAVAKLMLLNVEQINSNVRKPTDIRLRELELKERRLRLEESKTQAKLKKEEIKIKMQLKMEMRKMEVDREFRLTELRGQGVEVTRAVDESGADYFAVNPRWDDTLAGRTKKYNETLKHVLPFMPAATAELPQYFNTVEKLYAMYEVPVDLQAKLLVPLLNDRAKSVISGMHVGDMEKYDKLKRFLLAEFKLTPKEYKSRFDSAIRNKNEIHVLFAARLRNLLMYYLRSRYVVDDFDALCELIVSDRLKSCLPSGPLNYVLSLEGDDWFESDKVATLADIYMNNHSATVQSSMSTMSTNVCGDYSSRFNSTYITRPTGGSTISSSQPTQFTENTRVSSASYGRRCLICHSFSHIARFCPQNRGAPVNVRGRGGRRGRVGDGYGTSCYRGHRGDDYGSDGFRGGRGTSSNAQGAQVNFCFTLNQNMMGEHYRPDESESLDRKREFGEFRKTDSLFDDSTNNVSVVKVSPLNFVDVTVSGVFSKTLCDSGAQIPVVSRRLIEQCNSDVIGSVCLHGVIGKSVDAPLVNLSIKLNNEKELCNISPCMSVICAVADINADDYDVILPTDVVDELRSMPIIAVPIATVKVQSTETASLSPENTAVKNADSETAQNIDDLFTCTSVLDAVALIKEQTDDNTLISCWEMARDNKEGFIISRGLLCHNDKVLAQSICQHLPTFWNTQYGTHNNCVFQNVGVIVY